MNILEIVWILLTIVGVIACIKSVINENEWSGALIIVTGFSLMWIIIHFEKYLTTPLW